MEEISEVIGRIMAELTSRLACRTELEITDAGLAPSICNDQGNVPTNGSARSGPHAGRMVGATRFRRTVKRKRPTAGEPPPPVELTNCRPGKGTVAVGSADPPRRRYCCLRAAMGEISNTCQHPVTAPDQSTQAKFVDGPADGSDRRSGAIGNLFVCNPLTVQGDNFVHHGTGQPNASPLRECDASGSEPPPCNRIGYAQGDGGSADRAGAGIHHSNVNGGLEYHHDTRPITAISATSDKSTTRSCVCSGTSRAKKVEPVT